MKKGRYKLTKGKQPKVEPVPVSGVMAGTTLTPLSPLHGWVRE